MGARLSTDRMRRRRALCAAVATALLAVAILASTSVAGRVYPAQRVDASTGQSAVGLGAAIGNRRAWAAFAQETGGVDRLYVRFARNGRFGPTLFADRGNEITAGALTGDGRGNGILVWEEQIGNDGVVFSRRLANGRVGAVIRVSPPGSDAEFGDLMFPFERGRSIVMSRGGGAALCYDDGNDSFIATLRAGGGTWNRFEIPRSCTNDNNSDLGIDDRGNIVALTLDNNTLFADKVIRGQVVSEMVTNDVMDETAIGVGPGGSALAVGRDDTMDIFARRKADIAQGGPWTRVGGNLQDGLIIGDGRNAADPFAALDRNGDGIVVFPDNAMNGGQGLYRLVNDGNPGRGGVLYTSIGRASRIRLGLDRLGRPFTEYSKAATLDANGETATTGAFARVFARGAPGLERGLLPGAADSFAAGHLNFAVDHFGNFLALPGSFAGNVNRLFGVFGDFSRPNVRPRAFPRRPRARQRVRLASRPFDSFRRTGPGDVKWRVPRGVRIVKAFRKRGRRARGRKIRVVFRRAGRYRIRVTIGDRAGNRRTKFLRVRVRRARRR